MSHLQRIKMLNEEEGVIEERHEEHINLASNPNTISAVWNYFKIKTDNLENPLSNFRARKACV